MQASLTQIRPSSRSMAGRISSAWMSIPSVWGNTLWNVATATASSGVWSIAQAGICGLYGAWTWTTSKPRSRKNAPRRRPRRGPIVCVVSAPLPQRGT